MLINPGKEAGIRKGLQFLALCRLLISTNKKYLWPNMQKRISTVTPFSATILSSGNQEIIDFFPPRTDGSRHNHRCSLLHKRIGYCTSITIITGSDCSSTSQQNLHKTVFPKCSFFTEAPATNLFLLRRKLKHKHHLKRTLRWSHYRL